MTNCRTKMINFSSLKTKEIQCNFSGGKITSDGGVLLLREIDSKIRLTEKVSKLIPDHRNQSYISHSVLEMLRQRIYGIALGYEDLNDHNTIRHDGAVQVAVGFEQSLASSSTLCRFEKQANREIATSISQVLVEQFVASFTTAPKELILDFDATDNIIHGNQEGKYYHGYYKNDCFLPLHVFCGKQLLVSYLRKSSSDQALHAWAILSLLVKRFRKEWPNCTIIFRADSGFCRHKIFNWCEKNRVDYVVGISGNQRLKSAIKETMDKAEESFKNSNEKQRLFTSLQYAANSWKTERRVIAKAEHTSKGANPRFIVTSLQSDAQEIYDKAYCARGDMENRIKEQLLLFSDRTSCHKWWSNQMRMLFSAIAYILLERLRSLVLCGTSFGRLQVDTIRLKLMKIGGVIVSNTRRVRFMLSEYFPFKKDFFLIARKLATL